MDVVIPSHHVKLFNSSIISLSKIGKDLYLEFDSLKGLSLRTLNDGKSAYCHVHYEPTFFERCTVPSGNTTRTTTSRKRTLQENNDDDDDSSSQQTTNYYSCRIPLRALQPVVRPRKRVQSLRVTAPDQDAVALQFEFTLPHADTLLTVLHTIQVAANCQGVSACTATDIAASEIVASPIILSRLLEPLQRTAEAALIVRAHDAQDSTVSASSFHPEMAHHASASENGANSNNTNNNAIFQGNQAALLKSETAVAVDEFLEFDFVANRDILDDLPEECNREVILVFSLKECRAALQFLCSLEETMATLTFHWGGMPVTLSADQQSWSMTLVLATLDYKLLTSLRTPAAAK